ncbi:hypothetical protein CONCODRAFT_83692 [Conidiobolus coronatus NRRL 28638]|uniref:FZ domain-containing protein n=1 Tax=Conidiobolus coronatus (strain ATCC 28846 / CBS 209.66 / NRRL 28638) TaxID=796925 RepID=A0A137PDE3_CONC2|nr:hypothetical protein CONCODRAFT_83692 [Conidiobolus coronatus NRRL 28638]|eukprot:KXN73026.1 hypothetical protein CONCODRAFT_83692 [Conidiobolus coronatus NRRL 28638]
MNLMTVALLLLHTNQIISDSKSYEIKLGSSYSGSVKSGTDTYFKLTSASNAFQSPNIPNNLVYISLTLCSGTSGQDFQEPDIYYSLTDSTPGPNKSEKLKNNFTVENYPNWKVSNTKAGVPKGILLSTVTLKPKTSNDISLFLGVNLSGKNLEYNYQLGINAGSYFHNYSNQLGLALLDTDDSTASLTVISSDPSKFDNNTQTLYYKGSGGDSLFTTCALQSNNSTVVSSKSDSNKIKLGGKLPPQFMGTEAVISDLSRDTTYEAILVNNPSSSGQSTFNPPVSLKTSKYSDCRLMNQLGFCDMVSYSVPIPTHFITKGDNNQVTMDVEKAKKAYDDYAHDMYKKFENLIEQYDCDAHIYSPVRNCSDCKTAYKDWLCSMTFPRCSDEHHSTDETHSANANSIIAERDAHDKTKEFLPEELKEVNPYYEVKPCIDLCYYVVQSCPVAFEFTCPEQKSTLNYTYGIGTMQFDNLTSFESGLGDSNHLGDLPWGCNNMMRSVSNQAFNQFNTLLPLYYVILTILTFICISI